jgi:hypothetical protein
MLPRLGKDRREGNAMRKKLTSFDKFQLAVILPSLIPGAGIIFGIGLIILSHVDWGVELRTPPQKTRKLGLLCLVLGVITLAIWWYFNPFRM